jgi:protein-disulfide isomerase
MSEEKTEKNSGTITIKKDDLWKYTTFALLAVVVIILVVWAFPFNSPTGAAIGTTPPGNLPSPGERVQVEIGDAPVLGNPDAPVQIVEYTDYYCPFCQRNALETKPLLKSNFIDNGQVSYAMKNFQRVSADAANAALCAREVGGEDAFWQFSDALFEAGPQMLNSGTFNQIAQQLAVAGSEFENCVSSGQFNSLIQQQTQYAQSLGVSGTPGFFINGVPVSGAQPFSVFQQIIEQELNR